MVGLNEDTLTDMVRGLLAQARAYLNEQGFVAETLIGLSQTGIAATLAQVPEDLPTTEIARLRSRGVIAVPGPFRMFADQIKPVFAAAQVEAAIMLGEYWTIPDSAEAEDAYQRGVMPSEHPHRAEGVFVLASWPLGGWQAALSRQIVRDEAGRPSMRPWPRDTDITDYVGHSGVNADASMSVFITWLDDVLPHRGRD